MQRKHMIIAAIVSGVIALTSSYLFLTSYKQALLLRGRPQEVLVAAVHIEPFRRVDESMFIKKPIPAEYLNPGVLREAEEISGQFALAPISEGEQITANKFTPIEGGISPLVPAGSRGVPLYLDEPALFAGGLNPGDYVDVIGTFNIMESDQRYYNFTALLLSAVKVLAVGERTGTQNDSKKDKALGYETRENRVVTLLLSPRQSVFLSYCAERGNIRLALRSPYDREAPEVPSFTLEDLLKTAGLNQQKIIKIREKPSLEIIRGTDKQRERRAAP